MKSLLQCKWALQIIDQLYDGPRRPSELLRQIKGIKEKVLHHRLKALTESGIIERQSNERYPLVVTYHLVRKEELSELINIYRKSKMSANEFTALFSSKWTVEIMEMLQSPHQPKEILNNLKELSEKTLHLKLEKLLSQNLIKRRVLTTRPVKVVYELTREGRRVLPSLVFAKKVILSRQKRQSPVLKPGSDSYDSQPSYL